MSWFRKAPTYDSAEEQALMQELHAAINSVNTLLVKARKRELHVRLETYDCFGETDNITMKVHKHVR